MQRLETMLLMVVMVSSYLVTRMQASRQRLPLIPLMEASAIDDDDVLRFRSDTELELKWQSFKEDYGSNILLHRRRYTLYLLDSLRQTKIHRIVNKLFI